jgi:hypothetical protein
MPTYKQNSQSELALSQKPLEFAKPAALITAGPFEMGFTLDTSDSMNRLLDAAATGYNTLISEQREFGPGCLTFNTFASTVRPIHSGLELSSVPKIDRLFLSLHSGATALLDGIGSIIKAVSERTDKGCGSRALIAILTDGNENSSSFYRFEDVFAMIHYRRSVHKWEFLFMCANQCGEGYGLSLGIQKSNICRFDTDPGEIKLLLGRLSKAVGAYRLGDRNFAGFLTDRSR